MAALNSTPSTYRAFPLVMHDDNSAFFYVGGVPTNGLWLPLDDVESWEDLDAALCHAGFDAAGGDILCADIDGPLAACCYNSRLDSFDLASFIALREDVDRHNLEPDAIGPFIGWYGCWDREAFESAYMGHYDSEEEFAEQYLDDTGMLSEVPEHLQSYFDVDRFARDLFMGDYHFDPDGFVFCSNC